MTCEAVTKHGDHLYAVTYGYRWWGRKVMILRCYSCDLKIVEP